MSKYFVTSDSTQQYPFTFKELRARPQKKRSSLLIATVAITSALCGGAAAFAFMTSGSETQPVEAAALESAGAASASTIAQIETEEPAKIAEVKLASANIEPVVSEPAKVQTDEAEAAVAPAVVVREVIEPAPLAVSNPRWADDPVIPDQSTKNRAVKEAFAAVTKDVDIAESEAEVVALEEQMNPELTTGAISYAPEEQEENIKPARITAPSFATGDLTSARATKWVNMRAGKNKYAAKMLVVPQNAQIKADPACKHWCRVAYDGRLGYVYRTYIRFPGEGTVAKAPEPAEKSAETKPSGGFLNKLRDGFRPDP